MNGEKVGMETLSDVAGVPYDFDDLDLEMAMITRPSEGPRHAAAVIATSALKNAEWRAAFEANGSRYAVSTAGSSTFKGAPPVSLSSPEMLTWIEDKDKGSRPSMPKSVKAFRLSQKISSILSGKLFPIFFTLGIIPAWMLSNLIGVSEVSKGATLISLFNTQFGLIVTMMAAVLIGFKTEKINARLVKKFGAVLATAPLWLSLFILGRSTLVIAATAVIFIGISVAYWKLKKSNDDYIDLSIKVSLPPGVELSPWRKDPASTRFGSSLADFRSASGSLRLFADRFGIPLKAASKSDLVAATIAADAWMLSFNSQYFDQAATFGPDAVTSLGAIIARASGTGEMTPLANEGAYAKPDDINDMYNAVSDWKDWVSTQFADKKEIQEVWAKVISDLGNSSVGSLPHMLARSLSFESF